MTENVKRGWFIRVGVLGRSLLGGIATAVFMFLAFHRIDLTMGNPLHSLPLTFMALTAGWGIGVWVVQEANVSLIRARSFGAVTVALTSGLLFSPLNTDVLQTGLFVVAGACAVALLWDRSFNTSKWSVPVFLGGMMIGFLAMACGVVGEIGLRTTVLAGCLPGVIGGIFGPGRWKRETAGDGCVELARRVRLSMLFLSASSIMLAVALLRIYSNAPVWMAFGVVDLGLMFCAGLLLRHLLPVAPKPTTGGLIARGLGLLGVALLLGWSFVFYPDLIFSEPATMQSSPVLLAATRTFPLWGLAFVLAFLIPELPGRRLLPAGRKTLVSVLALAVLFVIPADITVHVTYFLAGVFALSALLLACEMGWEEGSERVEKVFPAVAGCVGMVAVTWMALVTQTIDWPGLKLSFAWYQHEVKDRFNAPQPPRLEPGRPDGVRVMEGESSPTNDGMTVELNGETGMFYRGGLMWSSRSQDSASVSVLVGMLPGVCDDLGRVATIAPVMEPTQRALKAFLPGTQLVQVTPRRLLSGFGRRSPEPLDALILGPGAMSGTRSSELILNVEMLRNARQWIREGGVLGMWLPTRSLNISELSTALTTVREVFPATVMFLVQDEVVLFSRVNDDNAGRKEEASSQWAEESINYGAIRTLFHRPRSNAVLSSAGYWDPRQFVGEMSSGVDGVRSLSQGGRTVSVWRPTRGSVLTRDLARASNPVLFALLIQHRLDWVNKLSGMLGFSSDEEQKIALTGLKSMYEVSTRELLLWIGESLRAGSRSEERINRLVSLLRGPRGRLGLLAEGVENDRMRLPVALYRLGLYARAMKEISGQKITEDNEFQLYYWRGRCLEKLEKLEDALKSYQKAHEARPENESVLLRMAEIELGRRGFQSARQHLQGVLEIEPDNVSALVRLSFVHGQMENYERATELAKRALQLDSDNAAARDQWILYRWQAR